MTWNPVADLKGPQGEPGPQGEVGPEGPQNLDSDLTAIAELTPTDGQIIVRSGGVWTAADTVTATAASVGLGNVDNTSDVDKPVSTAQAAALAAKAPAGGDYAAATFLGSTVRITPIDRQAATSTATIGAGVATYVGFTSPVSKSVNSLIIGSRSVVAAGTTLARMGLYTVDASGNLTLVARTASDTTLASTTFGTFTRTFDTTGGYPATYSVVKGVRYALGIIFVGSTTAPQLYGAAGFGTVFAWDPFLCVSQSAQTDLPATVSSSAYAGQGAAPFMALV